MSRAVDNISSLALAPKSLAERRCYPLLFFFSSRLSCRRRIPATENIRGSFPPAQQCSSSNYSRGKPSSFSFSRSLPLSRSNLMRLATFLAVFDFSWSSLPLVIWGHGIHVASRRERLRFGALSRPLARHKIRHRNSRCCPSRRDRWRGVSGEKRAEIERKPRIRGIWIFMYWPPFSCAGSGGSPRGSTNEIRDVDGPHGYMVARTCRSGGSIEEIYWYCSGVEEICATHLRLN